MTKLLGGSSHVGFGEAQGEEILTEENELTVARTRICRGRREEGSGDVEEGAILTLVLYVCIFLLSC